jgi:hypothetical protein
VILVRRSLIVFAALAVVLTACSKSSTTASPTAAPTTAPTTASSVPSPTPSSQVIGDCHIQPKTDCRKADLSGASLASVNLHSSTFSEANLRGADLHKANLRAVDFRRANLAGADLSEAKMQKANLDQTTLSGADLSYTNLTGAHVETSQLQSATLCHTIMPDGSNDVSGCAGASPSASPKPAGLAITKFSVSNADCLKTGHKRSNVNITYATTGATKVSFGLSGNQGATTTSTSGSYKLRIECTAKSVKVYIYAYAGKKTVSQHQTVSTGI